MKNLITHNDNSIVNVGKFPGLYQQLLHAIVREKCYHVRFAAGFLVATIERILGSCKLAGYFKKQMLVLNLVILS